MGARLQCCAEARQTQERNGEAGDLPVAGMLPNAAAQTAAARTRRTASQGPSPEQQEHGCLLLGPGGCVRMQW